MKHLLEEQTQLREQWEEATKARNALLKDVGRERRQHDVEKQTWLEKCSNLEAALELRKKKEDGRKLQHQTAMAKADSLCGRIRQRLGALEKEAGQLAWQQKKHRQLVARESASVEIKQWSVKRKEIQVARQQEMITKRQDAVVGKEVVLLSKLGKVAALKQVFWLSIFYSFATPLENIIVGTFLPQNYLQKTAEVKASRQVWSRQSKQTNKKLKQKETQLGVLQAKLCKVLYNKHCFSYLCLTFRLHFVRFKRAILYKLGF
jgi:hypothetical protein